MRLTSMIWRTFNLENELRVQFRILTSLSTTSILSGKEDIKYESSFYEAEYEKLK